MAKPYSALRAKMSPEARAKAVEQTRQLLKEMPFQELRQARNMNNVRLNQFENQDEAVKA